MTKSNREQIRVDLLTSQLVDALVNKLTTKDSKKNKSEIYRSAVYLMAKQQLTSDEFVQAVETALDLENN